MNDDKHLQGIEESSEEAAGVFLAMIIISMIDNSDLFSAKVLQKWHNNYKHLQGIEESFEEAAGVYLTSRHDY